MLIRIGYFLCVTEKEVCEVATGQLPILSQQESDMIVMLIRGETITDIADRLGVNRKTIYNWLNKDYVKVELDKRKQELTHQGNNIILKDLTTYINNIKALANDPSDKRVALAANQYLINRIYGTPTNIVEVGDNADNTATEVNKIEIALSKMKSNHWKK